MIVDGLALQHLEGAEILSSVDLPRSLIQGLVRGMGSLPPSAVGRGHRENAAPERDTGAFQYFNSTAFTAVFAMV